MGQKISQNNFAFTVSPIQSSCDIQGALENPSNRLAIYDSIFASPAIKS